jgi:hypothetical protein
LFAETESRPDDPAWEVYPDTVLVIRPEPAPAFEIDLRTLPDAGIGMLLKEVGLEAPFAVLTACNPLGRQVGSRTNRRRTRELAERLSEVAATIVAVDGRSPDGRHCEPGYGVRLSLNEAQRIAAEFRQTALFWWDGSQFWIVEATDGGRRRRLPLNP